MRQQSQQHLFLLLPLPLLPGYQAGDLMFVLGNNKRVPNIFPNQCIFSENSSWSTSRCTQLHCEARLVFIQILFTAC